ncbi:MAG: hypothetical protein Kapaf2KO_04640 [Candidatus Kapaibacteriales bacterium]
MTKFLYSVIFSLITISAYGQLQRGYHRVYFQPKIEGDFSINHPKYESALNQLSEKTLARRYKTFAYRYGLDSAMKMQLANVGDIPIEQSNIDLVSATGAKYMVHSNWNNYAVFDFDSPTIDLKRMIEELPFVVKVEFIDSLQILGGIEEIHIDSVLTADDFPCEDFDYGSTFRQTNNMQIPDLHRLGWRGQGVTIALLDNGFITDHKAIKHIKVLDKYDFIQGDTIVSNEEGEVSAQDDHGTMVMGTIAALVNGLAVGTAPYADFMLYKTEWMIKESKIEEEFFLAAVERAERLGADIISSSLGYRNFDSNYSNYSYEMLDGETTVTARAYNRAAELGVVCVTSLGNSGQNRFGTLGTPADAFGVLAIGGTQLNDKDLSGFSSTGPSSDGRIKPDLVARGTSVFTISPFDTLTYSQPNGTSFSAPLVAGSIASLLSAKPYLTADEIRPILREYGTNADEPDNLFGYGFPQFKDVYFGTSPLISRLMFVDLQDNGKLFRRVFVKRLRFEENENGIDKDFNNIKLKVNFTQKSDFGVLKEETKGLVQLFGREFYIADFELDGDATSTTMQLDYGEWGKGETIINLVDGININPIYGIRTPISAIVDTEVPMSSISCEVENEVLAITELGANEDFAGLSPNRSDIFAYFVDDKLWITSNLESISNGTDSFEFALYDKSGKLIEGGRKEYNMGIDKYQLLNSNLLSTGSYYLQIITDKESRVLGVIKL